MAQFYYDKYNASASYINDSIPLAIGSGNISWYNLYKAISFDNNKNTYSGSSGSWFSGNAISVGTSAYNISSDGKTIDMYVSTTETVVSGAVPSTHYVKSATNNSATYSKGTLVQSNIPAEDGTYPANGRHTDGYWYVKGATVNTAPIVSLTGPSNSTTLYETDTFNILGNAYDSDKDQSVTVYYQINSEPRKVLATNLSQTQITLSKQLTFKGGKIYDADIALTETLADGVAHTLKVWAVDSEGAQSTVESRTFYVVANRAPILTVNNPTPSGVIDSDSFTITGTFSDPDGNVTTVVYRINGGNPIQIGQGVSGDFTFELTLGSLQIGANVITIEATDSYGAKTTKTVKLNKSKIATPITRSTVRYKVAPPSGTASEILVWVQRDANLTLDASVSMTLSGEAESFNAMTKNSTTTLPDGKVEDEFYHQVAEAKDSIILKFDLAKSSVETDAVITLITGVF